MLQNIYRSEEFIDAPPHFSLAQLGGKTLASNENGRDTVHKLNTNNSTGIVHPTPPLIKRNLDSNSELASSARRVKSGSQRNLEVETVDAGLQVNANTPK